MPIVSGGIDAATELLKIGGEAITDAGVVAANEIRDTNAARQANDLMLQLPGVRQIDNALTELEASTTEFGTALEGGAVKALGNTAMVAGAGFIGFSVYSDVQQEYTRARPDITPDERNFRAATAGVIVAAASTSGAVLGGLAGSAVELGLGTVVGAVGGGYVGEKFGEGLAARAFAGVDAVEGRRHGSWPPLLP